MKNASAGAPRRTVPGPRPYGVHIETENLVEHVKAQSWALLLDGSVVSVRPVRPADKEAIADLHNAMSPDNRYLRFFGFSPDASRRLAEKLCEPASAGTDGRCALGVWQAGELLGVAHYEVDPANRLEAEIALAVADHAHSKGIGTLLLEHLASRARAAGIARFTADVLTRNAPMLRVFADAGLRIIEHRDHDVMAVVASLEVSEAYLDSVSDREATAQTASLQHLLAPRSVVVVGASERAGNIGGLVVRNLVKAGFLGRVDVVHPVADVVFGVHAWPSLADLPSPPELAVIAVPARAVAETIESCGCLGVRAVVVLTAGIDAVAGRDILDRCRRHGMRLVGPNCLGIAVPNHSLDLTFTAHRPAPGVAGVAVQSGGVGIAVTDQLDRLGIGISSLVSLGDKYDVSATDLLQHWSHDPDTELALLYIESFGNPRKFARAAARLSRRIPVLAVDGGRSAPAQRAAVSHTAAAATPTAARQALFVDAGIIAVNDMGDLVATAALLATQPLPSGRRVAVVSNAGGAGILLADACADAGLELPPLSPSTIERLTEVLPPGATFTNPVDASAACDRTSLAAGLVALAADPNIDAVLALPLPTGVDEFSEMPWPKAPLPVAGVRPDQPELVRVEGGSPHGVRTPVFGSARQAAEAVARAATRTAWLARPPRRLQDPADLPGFDIARCRLLVADFLSEHPDGGWLDPERAAALLSTIGVRPQPLRLVRSAEDAAAAAGEFTGPVAVKAYGPDLLHKRHAGALVLGVDGGGPHAWQAYTDLEARLADTMRGAVVQPMAGGDLELLVGVNSDSVFGPVIAFGLGGTEADALADRVVRLAPLDPTGAGEMLRGIRAAGVLDTAADGEPVDIDALQDLLVRVSVLADRVPELADMDLNPVLARREGFALVDVKVRLCPRQAYDPFLRRLR